jgi:AcrR family transcriptional regulator
MTDDATPAAAVRSRARAEMKHAILSAARERLARDGAQSLSLRAVARDVGMVSSAVYRYVPHRDALLTELIVESYDSLGAAAEASEGDVPRGDLAGRLRATGRATRAWALANPHEWALIYGSPIPGYAAPDLTISAASRIPSLLTRMLADAQRAGVALPDAPPRPGEAEALWQVVEFFPDGVPLETVARGLMVYTYLLGSVSAQVFGQRNNVVTEAGAAAFFDGELDRMAAFMGFGDLDG